MPRKPQLSKIGDSSMQMNQQGMAKMTPKLMKGNQGNVPMPKKPKVMKAKVPKLNLPDPVG